MTETMISETEKRQLLNQLAIMQALSELLPVCGGGPTPQEQLYTAINATKDLLRPE